MSIDNKDTPLGSGGRLIGLSVSFDKDNLLARGLGLDHLNELLLRLARPLLRQGANLAYGGNWNDTEGNFTFELLRLVSAEKTVEAEHQLAARDVSGPADPVRQALPLQSVGRLFNHCAWPHYLKITPAIEAQWINCCRIVRITPALAGIPESERIPREKLPLRRDDKDYPSLALLHEAVCLTVMRRLAMDGLSLQIPDVPGAEIVPPISARIVLGGKTSDYAGFMPGIFEEVLLSLDRRSPLYLLGGFGGAAEVLAEALLADAAASLPEALDYAWQRLHTPGLANLHDACQSLPLPAEVIDAEARLATLGERLTEARADLAGALNTGLDEAENRELLSTRDMRRAVRLVHLGLQRRELMKALKE